MLGIVVSNVYAAGPCVALGVVVESCGFMVRVGWRKRASLNGTSGDARRFMPPRVNSVAFSRYLSSTLIYSSHSGLSRKRAILSRSSRTLVPLPMRDDHDADPIIS